MELRELTKKEFDGYALNHPSFSIGPIINIYQSLLV